jgi:hypothetical protein
MYFALLALTACDDAADLEKTATDARADAREEIADATRDASQSIRDARAEADVKVAATDATFAKMQADYQHTTSSALATLDKQIADLEAKALTSNGQDRASRNTRLLKIRAQRDGFGQSYGQMDALAGAEWDAAKVRVDAEWKALKLVVDEA